MDRVTKKIKIKINKQTKSVKRPNQSDYVYRGSESFQLRLVSQSLSHNLRVDFFFFYERVSRVRFMSVS